MATYEQERQENLNAYEKLKDEIRAEYSGQYVAIANGRLITASTSFDEADRAVIGYRHRLVFPADEEPVIGPLRARNTGAAQ